MSSPNFNIKWSNGYLTDLNLTDDIALLAPCYKTMQHMTERLQECMKK